MRRALNTAGLALFAILAFLAVLPLFLIIIDVYTKGISAILRLGGLNFLFDIPPSPDAERGGVGPLLVGTLYMTLLGAIVGILLGFPLGVYIGEFRKEYFANISRGGVNILVEFPTITVGLFVYALFSLSLVDINPILENMANVLSGAVGDWVKYFVGGLSQFNAYAGALALAIIMVPYVALFTASAYATIDQNTREAAYAIAGREYKAVFIVLRKAVSRAVLVAVLLGTAKIAGETAPLLFTAYGNYFYSPFTQATGAIPHWIWYAAQTPYDVQIASAYGAAAVLLTIVLAIFLAARSRR
ncbi:MAG: PstA family ABC transporter permease [Pyrobaculum sp.]